MELSSSKIKKFLIFPGMEISGSDIKKFLIFSQKKAFLIFQQMELSYVSRNGNTEKIPYFSGNGTFLHFRKLLIFQEVTFQVRIVKKTHS